MYNDDDGSKSTLNGRLFVGAAIWVVLGDGGEGDGGGDGDGDALRGFSSSLERDEYWI